MKKALFFICILCTVFLISAQAQTDTLKIFFDIDRSDINDENANMLDSMLNGKEIQSIDITGYTDFLGDTAYNRALSEKRSTGVKNYLISKGLPESCIRQNRGLGVYPNSSDAMRKDMTDKGIFEHRMVMLTCLFTHPQPETAGTVETVEIKKEKTMKEKLAVENLVVGANIVLENTFFYNNSDRFRPISYPTLELLLQTMQDNPTLKIEIQGYACCMPHENDINDKQGKYISKIRAKAVYDYLVKNGIDSDRMTYKGFGRTNKRFPDEKDSYERNMNRRVEMKILAR